MRMMKLAVLVLLVMLCQPVWSRADEAQLNRQEITVVKKKLVEVVAALGGPPSGYVKAEESYDLPTSTYSVEGGGYQPVYASASLSFDGGADKMSAKSEKDLEAEYRKKILEAQAAGDYEAMGRLSQEMVQKATQLQMAVEEARREPVKIYVRFNNNPSETIDPDAVVFENPGVIALKSLNNDQLQVNVYFDPVKLKDTMSLSRVDLSDQRQQGSNLKTAVRNITIQMNGPADVVEPWSKQINTSQVLALIDKE
jgi:hypothetical protein